MKKPKRGDRSQDELVRWWFEQPDARKLEIIEAVEYSDRRQEYLKWKGEQK